MNLKNYLYLVIFFSCLFFNHVFTQESNLAVKRNPNVSIAYLVPDRMYGVNYPNALESLLNSLNQQTTVRVNTEPVYISSPLDENLRKCPFLYFNLGDKQEWSFTADEKEALKEYIERGGFIYVDAGIQASFLENTPYQNHSFAEWKASKKLENLFADIYPSREFKPLPKTHAIFSTFKAGLPDTSNLPDTVKEFVIHEKWPGGTYSLVGFEVKGRLAVVASPIVAMGWAKEKDGRWSGNIMLRINEGGKDLTGTLQSAITSETPFQVTNEDGTKDTVYAKDTKPAWVKEFNGKYKIYKYYGGNEINDFTHQFFTQLGVNIIFYALTN